jgi:hypothetical protein
MPQYDKNISERFHLKEATQPHSVKLNFLELFKTVGYVIFRSFNNSPYISANITLVVK